MNKRAISKRFSIEIRYLFALLAAALRGETPEEPPRDLNWKKTLDAATRHQVANIAFYAVEKIRSSVPSNIFERFQAVRNFAVFSECARDFEVGAIFKAFDRRQIRYLPLKGTVLKTLYPSSEMRLMSDVDLLLETESKAAADEIMTGLGFVFKSETAYHGVYVKPPCVSVELHDSFFDEDDARSPFDSFRALWSRLTRRSEDSFEYVMSPNDFYLYLLEHMAKHFRGEGIRIRHLVDVWVYLQKRGAEIDRLRLARDLERVRLNKFAANIERLASVWFDGAPSDENLDELALFILQERDAAVDAANSANLVLAGERLSWAGKIRCFLHLAFPSYRRMALNSRFLRRFPPALPFYWAIGIVKRALRPGARKRVLALFRMKADELERFEDVVKKSGF